MLLIMRPTKPPCYWLHCDQYRAGQCNRVLSPRVATVSPPGLQSAVQLSRLGPIYSRALEASVQSRSPCTAASLTNMETRCKICASLYSMCPNCLKTFPPSNGCEEKSGSYHDNSGYVQSEYEKSLQQTNSGSYLREKSQQFDKSKI